MKYRNYNVQLTEKRVEINKLFYSKWVVELKSKIDYIFYLTSDLNLINETDLYKKGGFDLTNPFHLKKSGFEILIEQLKLIVDKRIIEKTMFNYKQ